MGFQIGQVLRQGALRHGERAALEFAGSASEGEGRVATYAELDRGAERVAAALRARGIAPGARVALSAANGWEFLVGFFGAAYAGVTVVPIPILSAVPEVRDRIERARCGALLVDAARALVLGDACTSHEGAATVPMWRIETLHEEGHSGAGAHDLPASTDAMLLFTSGTTGGAKAARITHASLLTHTAALVHHTLRLSERDVVLGVLPWTHSFGLRMSVLAPLFAGAKTLAFERFHADETLAQMDRGRVSWVPAVPTMFAAWARTHGGEARGIRWALSAGAPLPSDLRDRASVRLRCPVRQGYGLTEATFSTIDDGLGRAQGEEPEAPRGPAAGTEASVHVGRPVWGVELSIRDDQGRALATGREGEVWVRGQNVMAGYLDDEAATAAVMRAGWLRTGDLGRMDAAGQLTLVDRLKDLILRGGANVYPSEVEEVLHDHPAVLEVAVVGRPDDYYGEEVVAVLVVRPPQTNDEADSEADDETDDHAQLDPEALVRALDELARGRIAKNKVPREYAFLASMPLGPSGKVLKRALRAMLQDGTLETRRP